MTTTIQKVLTDPTSSEWLRGRTMEVMKTDNPGKMVEDCKRLLQLALIIQENTVKFQEITGVKL